MKQYQIICIDDDKDFLRSLKKSLPEKVKPLCRDFACVFDFVTSSAELRKVLAQAAEDDVCPAMLISDQLMPDVTGIDLIEQIKGDYPDLVCVLLTGHAGLDSARQAINHRLLDQYVCKPIEDMHEFASLAANLLKQHHLDLEEKIRTAQLAEKVEEIRAMKAAAEEVAMLSKGLKSLDFDEVVKMASSEVPNVFRAHRGVLCFVPDVCPTELISRENCSCPQPELLSRADVRVALQDGQISCGEVPEVCGKLGGQSPDIIVPLSIAAAAAGDGKAEDRRGYLCMCNMDPAIAGSADLIKYKARLISEILSASLTNAKLYQQAKRDSQTDLLTGVNTRRVLEEKLEAERDRAVRYKRPFCIAIVDIDRFKEVNDASGHAVGDQALRQLTDILRQEIRKTDTLARYGGDEFVVLMPETDLDIAVNVIERVRKKAESSLATYGQNTTISCGVAGWSGADGESGTEVFRRADAALYKAKRLGRNKVVVEKAA